MLGLLNNRYSADAAKTPPKHIDIKNKMSIPNAVNLKKIKCRFKIRS